MKPPLSCPKCSSDLRSQEIPQQYRSPNGNTHYSRVVGVDGSWMGIYDGIIAWMCPECKHQWPISEEKYAKEMFKRYEEVMNESNKG